MELRPPVRGDQVRNEPTLTTDTATPPRDTTEPSADGEKPLRTPGGQHTPSIEGSTPYTPEQLRDLLRKCSTGEQDDHLRACAAILTAQLVRDGYFNTRVYTRAAPAPGVLEVVEGHLVEIRVSSNDAALARTIERLLLPLKGQVLHIPTVEHALQQLRNLPGIANVRGNLSRLGSDPSQATLLVSAQPKAMPWQGELSLRNDGSNGSGEGRSIGVVSKTDVAGRGDTLLLYVEADSARLTELGGLITSASYTWPISERIQLTGSMGYSRRNLVELPTPLNALSSSQYQGLGQLEWILHNRRDQRWAAFAGVSFSRSNSFIAGSALPIDVPSSFRNPQNGYLRIGISGNGWKERMGWGGNVYLLQGLPWAMPAEQRSELADIGITARGATALGGIISSSWLITKNWQFTIRAAAQLAFQPLTTAMQFTIGSDAGIRGLPGQLMSGDSGWLGTGELSWSLWRNRKDVLAIIPFIGCGGVSTTVNGFTASDVAGAAGILLRWLHGEHWSTEMGYSNQFETSNNIGPWNNWLLDKGLYAQLKYRF